MADLGDPGGDFFGPGGLTINLGGAGGGGPTFEQQATLQQMAAEANWQLALLRQQLGFQDLELQKWIATYQRAIAGGNLALAQQAEIRALSALQERQRIEERMTALQERSGAIESANALWNVVSQPRNAFLVASQGRPGFQKETRALNLLDLVARMSGRAVRKQPQRERQLEKRLRGVRGEVAPLKQDVRQGINFTLADLIGPALTPPPALGTPTGGVVTAEPATGQADLFGQLVAPQPTTPTVSPVPTPPGGAFQPVLAQPTTQPVVLTVPGTRGGALR